VDGVDYTYTLHLDHAADFFFDIPSTARRWIASLDQNGSGLVQVSTDLLRGRKLFLWGSGAGGRKWQRFLSPQGGEYLEIQAGLARTQMEHIMPPGARAGWKHGFCKPTSKVHHLNGACPQAVGSLWRLIPAGDGNYFSAAPPG
jgi:hypothetical protein